jgi:uncharacterized protein
MRKSRFAFFAVALLAIAFPIGSYLRSQTAQQGRGGQVRQANYYADPEWMKTKYGGWGGPGVNGGPGPMDNILLKDWAPKSSVVVPETSVPKARYAAIDVHAHVTARTPEEVAAWVKTMDDVGIQTSIVLTRFQLFCGIDATDMDKGNYPKRAAAELVRCY